jgi:transposase-like protein
MELLGGKATVEQLARRYGVLPETVEGWRTEAVAAIEDALRRGDGRTERELELERENELLREAVTHGTIQVALMQKQLGIVPRPFRQGRSRK